ncbi:protein artichoke isoform X1 [Nasonia vitripennis]|uniref:Uncharacterized protein n=1 Tax=Nasonia vitripennis TaxID=7425 RepID=A0A7M7QPX7_NASVI|nr:protein artichoke isoform X1 [Nasonia vitripennis]XP_032451870.1 protein artichoke isoform X1 [Nasonia vitripennis]
MFESSQRLRIINLSNNLLQEIHVNVFKNLKGLEMLNLSNNKIKTLDSAILPSLKSLDLSNNSISDLDFQFHKAYPKLTELNLSYNKLDDSINGTLTLLRQLKHLDLSHNNFTLLDNEDFNVLTNLISLNLSHNSIKFLTRQKFPESLIVLNVGFNYLSTFPATNLSKVKILNIEFNQISEMPTITNNELCDMKFLNISGNKLVNWPNLKATNLQILDLSYNKFSSIPVTLNKENYPTLENLIFDGNLITKIEFPSLLNLHSLIMRNMTYVESIDRNSFEKLSTSAEKDCLNLTLTDNKKLRYLDAKAFDGLNLCMLNLKNNQFTYFNPMLSKSGFMRTKFGVDLEGNPLHCNCSLQWMIDDLVPWLYLINPDLLNNLRCMTPESLKGKRMVHWYMWKEQVLCNNTRLYSSRMTAETLQVLSRNNPITLQTSNGMLIVLVLAVITLLVLVVVGIIYAKKISSRRSRMNRRF